MKNLLTFFLTALLAFSVGWAEEVTFNASTDKGSVTTNGTTANGDHITKDGVTVTSSNGPMGNGTDYRVYTGGTLTVTSSSGNITKIEMTFTASGTSNYGPSKISATGYSYSGKVGTWQGTAASTVTFSASAQARITNIVVTVSGGAAPQENWYRKVTSTSSLVAGKKYIIVNEANGVGMGALNDNRFGVGVTGLTFDNGRVDIGGTNVMEMTLGGSSNNWTFQMPNGNYLSNSSSSNNTFFSSASVQTSSTDITKWTITPSADACDIQSNYVTAQYIRFNSSGLFGTYGITAQSPVALYVEDDGSTVETCATPTFSPAAGTYNEAQDVTITTTTSGASIYYTTDNSTPSSTNGTLYTGTINVSETTTIKAIAVKTGNNDSQVAEATYTIETGGDSGSTIYRKVTSTDDLIPGQKYIIMLENGNSSVGMGAYDGSKHFNGVQNLTISNNKVNIANTSVLELTLAGTTDNWTLYTGNGYIQGADAVQFNIVDNATATNSKWIITNSVANTNGFVVENAQYSRYIKCYNNSTFRHYGSSNGNWAYLYVQVNNNQPTLHAEPNPLNINDTNEANGKTGTILVSGDNLGNDNVGMTFNQDHSTNFSSNPGYFSHNGTVTDYPVAITYTGHALSATGIVYPANNIASTSVNINYLYTGPIYVIGDVNNTYWNTNNGAQMTRDENGVYSTTVSVQQSDGTAGYISFTKQLGSNYAAGQFGPISNGNWWYNDDLNDIYQPVDTLGNKNNIRILPGTYTITVNPATNEFKIKRYVIDVTISPADGTTFTGSTISGTITSDPAGNIEWSTDGNNWQAYTDGFTLTANQVGDYVTVYARSTSNGVTSTPVSATYQRVAAPAPDAPSFSIGSSAVAAGTVITITAPEGCTLYVNGEQVTNPYYATINEATTITAYCVNDEGTSSTTVTNSYTIATVCNAIIEFKDSNSDSTTATSWDAIGGTGNNDYFEAGKDYLDGASNISRVFKGMTGLKYGNSSNGGTITFSLDDQTEWKVSHITLNAKNYNGNDVTFTVSTDNGQSETTSAIRSTLGGYTLDFDGSAITSITISASARAYLKGFTITYDCAPSIVNPVINPASGRYSEDQEVTITCSTPDATIYYTVNGGETQTYTAPFTVDVDEEHTQTTIVAWAVKDGLTSEQVTATYTYYSYNGHVGSIAEFLELNNGEEAIFDNPVVVLFDYSQARNSNYEPNGQEYIWIKDRTGYTQLFIQPAFDNTQGGFVPKYENGDVIPAGFKVKKNYFDNGQYYQGQCTDTHSTFQEANSKALADPEQVKLSELLGNPADYNNRYLYINKLQVSDISGLNFSVSADENGDNVSEVQGGSAIVGYNKYNSPAWKNKQGDVVGVTLPTDDNYYNVKFIFQKWQGGYEIMPIEFTLWEETSLLLEDLVQVGVEGQPYTISNQLHAVAVTWDNNRGKFAIFAKDDHMYAEKSYPTAEQESYLIRYENGSFINEVEQKDYDQSNWIEILIPSEVTQKPSGAYQSTLDWLKETYENKLLAAGSVTGTYVDALNPTIEVTTRPSAETASTYTPNIYCTVNFPMYNFENGGAQGNDGIYFMMDAKPHEFCRVVWAFYEGSGNYFIAPQREGNEINGHDFKGSFLANMSLCEDENVVGADVLPQYFSNSTDAGLLYGFRAIVRKNPNYSNPASGAPRRIQPSNSGIETNPAYIVYPLNAASNSSDNVVSVKEVMGNKAIESVHYYNMMGMEGKTPFEGINIVVTRYTDGSTSTTKVMK